jgi:hypothetical protein
MPPKKIRCTYKDCREGAQRIIGDCGFCNGHYCGKHRLLEDHKCDGLEDVSLPILSLSPSASCSATSPLPSDLSDLEVLHSLAGPEGCAEKDIQWWLVGLSEELLANMTSSTS